MLLLGRRALASCAVDGIQRNTAHASSSWRRHLTTGHATAAGLSAFATREPGAAVPRSVMPRTQWALPRVVFGGDEAGLTAVERTALLRAAVLHKGCNAVVFDGDAIFGRRVRGSPHWTPELEGDWETAALASLWTTGRIAREELVVSARLSLGSVAACAGEIVDARDIRARLHALLIALDLQAVDLLHVDIPAAIGGDRATIRELLFELERAVAEGLTQYYGISSASFSTASMINAPPQRSSPPSLWHLIECAEGVKAHFSKEGVKAHFSKEKHRFPGSFASPSLLGNAISKSGSGSNGALTASQPPSRAAVSARDGVNRHRTDSLSRPHDHHLVSVTYACTLANTSAVMGTADSAFTGTAPPPQSALSGSHSNALTGTPPQSSSSHAEPGLPSVATVAASYGLYQFVRAPFDAVVSVPGEGTLFMEPQPPHEQPEADAVNGGGEHSGGSSAFTSQPPPLPLRPFRCVSIDETLSVTPAASATSLAAPASRNSPVGQSGPHAAAAAAVGDADSLTKRSDGVVVSNGTAISDADRSRLLREGVLSPSHFHALSDALNDAIHLELVWEKRGYGGIVSEALAAQATSSSSSSAVLPIVAAAAEGVEQQQQQQQQLSSAVRAYLAHLFPATPQFSPSLETLAASPVSAVPSAASPLSAASASSSSSGSGSGAGGILGSNSGNGGGVVLLPSDTESARMIAGSLRSIDNWLEWRLARGRTIMPALGRVLRACAAAAAASPASSVSTASTASAPSFAAPGGATPAGTTTTAVQESPSLSSLPLPQALMQWGHAYALSLGGLVSLLDSLLDGVQAKRTRSLSAALDGLHPPLAVLCPRLEDKVLALVLSCWHVGSILTEVPGAFGLRRKRAGPADKQPTGPGDDHSASGSDFRSSSGSGVDLTASANGFDLLSSSGSGFTHLNASGSGSGLSIASHVASRAHTRTEAVDDAAAVGEATVAVHDDARAGGRSSSVPFSSDLPPSHLARSSSGAVAELEARLAARAAEVDALIRGMTSAAVPGSTATAAVASSVRGMPSTPGAAPNFNLRSLRSAAPSPAISDAAAPTTAPGRKSPLAVSVAQAASSLSSAHSTAAATAVAPPSTVSNPADERVLIALGLRPLDAVAAAAAPPLFRGDCTQGMNSGSVRVFAALAATQRVAAAAALPLEVAEEKIQVEV